MVLEPIRFSWVQSIGPNGRKGTERLYLDKPKGFFCFRIKNKKDLIKSPFLFSQKV